MIPRSKSFRHQEEMVKEAIGSATTVEAIIIYHMIAPSLTSEYQAQGRRTMRMRNMPITTRRAYPRRSHQTSPTTRRRRTLFSLGQ
jgi:hypothetical protein